MVSGLTFRSLIPFEFILMYNVRKVVHSGPFVCGCPVYSAPFIERIIFSPLYFLTPLL